MTVLVVSDLHLKRERADLIALFVRFCGREAARARTLYILGDLFEVWLGDDFIPPEYQPVLTALRELASSGVGVKVMHGNRDFLLGEQFAALTGCELIADPSFAEIEGHATALLHGDILCTEDLAYQAMRERLRNLAFIREFLAKPIAERVAFAQQLRSQSENEKQQKSAYIMDVNPSAVEALLRRHHLTRIIHGHTHRPGIHEFLLDGEIARRYVLGDWETQPNYLVCDGPGWRLEAL